MNKRGIKISLNSNQNGNKIEIMGIENRIEQILANLLENSISFSEDNKKIIVKLSKKNNSVMLDVLDEGSGFKENDTKKIFNRNLKNFGYAIFETGFAWFWSDKKINKKIRK